MAKSNKSRTGADLPFWQVKTLDEMSQAEWESLCDGCAQCCILKLEDEDTGEILATDVACTLLDIGTCRCRDYANRHKKVPDCARIDTEAVKRLTWLPKSCAYRRLAKGQDLLWWHPLVSGDPNSVHEAGISARGRVVSEDGVAEEDLPDHICPLPSER